MGAILLFGALTFYAATSEVSWLFLLALWLLFIVPAAFAYAAWNRRGVTVSLAVRESRPALDSPLHDLPDAVLRRSPRATPVFEGDEMGLEIAFRSRRGARGPVWASGQVRGETFGAGAGVVTGAGWARTRWAPTARRGAVRASGWALGTSDPLGLFQGLRRLPEAELALILPKFKSLASHRESLEVEASLAAPRAGSGNEMFGVREYRPGDSLRRIHWRSSARHGELVVREYEPPGAQTVSILLDPTPPTPEVADQIARIAASEAWDCLREGGRVVVPDAVDTRDIWVVLEWLARYPSPPDGTPDFPKNSVVVTANPALLRAGALRNWLVGDAPVTTDIQFQRVGVKWPI